MNDVFKVYTVNGIALGVAHLTEVKEVLSVALILITIGYTVHKWRKSSNSKEDNE